MMLLQVFFFFWVDNIKITQILLVFHKIKLNTQVLFLNKVLNVKKILL
jgi:hypothetical protein